MSDCDIRIYSKGKKLPPLDESHFFHSSELFHILEQTPGCTPYLCVASTDGDTTAHLLAVVYRRRSWFPPYYYSHGRIYGEGVYAPGADMSKLFGQMLQALTRQMRKRHCLYIELSDLSKKMFGYRHLRREGYFPVRWLRIHNSLHSKPPEERLAAKARRHIDQAHASGVETREATTEEEVLGFHQLLHRYYRFKFQRFIPRKELFTALWKSHHSQILLTTYKDKIIGGSALVYSHGDAYLWYMASLDKSQLKRHPRSATLWHALTHCHASGLAHLRFMNVGLPFSKNPIRESIMRFGGKPTSTFRWFRFRFGIINKVVGWFLNE